MNLVILLPADFVSATRARLTGRRLDEIHRIGSETLRVGLLDGRMGTAKVVGPGELEVQLDGDPPAPLPITLVLALPRPKVLNRVIASAASMGIKRIFLINAWRVEKSYWSSPRLAPDNLSLQSILGLEQARDTILPAIALHRFFRRFVEEELPGVVADTRALVAHPGATAPFPRGVREAVTLAIGPEGGFIAAEIASLERVGFEAVTIGERILRVETALAWAVSRLCAS